MLNNHNMREYRKLILNTWEDEEININKMHYKNRMALCLAIMLCVLFWVVVFAFLPKTVGASEINTDKIADAIYKTENSKNHPYGIMVKYKHTTARQACLNTINHSLRHWDGKGDFIVFLGKTYSPPDINPNWVRLVYYFINKSGTDGKKALT